MRKASCCAKKKKERKNSFWVTGAKDAKKRWWNWNNKSCRLEAHHVMCGLDKFPFIYGFSHENYLDLTLPKQTRNMFSPRTRNSNQYFCFQWSCWPFWWYPAKITSGIIIAPHAPGSLPFACTVLQFMYQPPNSLQDIATQHAHIQSFCKNEYFIKEILLRLFLH